MNYREIQPSDPLKSYVKCFYIYESHSNRVIDDTVFPSGCMEIIFNLGAGQWQTASGTHYRTTPQVELWGQIIRPLAVRSIGKNTMLGIRFFPHGATFLFNEDVELYNNQVADYSDLAGASVNMLHNQLLETDAWADRIELLDSFLLHRLSLSDRRLRRAAVVGDIMRVFKQDDFFDRIDDVACQYGITSRYLQKLFLKHTGLTPKLYRRINRFQHSLRLLSKRETPLTSIAYDCGYFDQSHFIREFKSFTGLTPSSYPAVNSSITSIVSNT